MPQGLREAGTMNLELVGALNELEKERGISKEILREAIEMAIVTAYKRNHGAAQNVRVEMDDRTGRIRVFAQKEVVEEVEDEGLEISLEDAQRMDPSYQVGDLVDVEVTPRDFGRIAAQTAKQVVIQRIREAERTLIYEEFASKQGDIVTGIVQRSDPRIVHVDLGKIEATLPASEQMPGDSYTHGSRIKVYITEVRKTTKGPQVLISRTHPGLLKRLFELEVPEIHDGIVEIKGVAREAGHRSKIAVASRDPHVDPVGACVGPRGVRVQAVVAELKGEKIDIIAWDPDPRRFVANALSPAKVVNVFVDPLNMTARAVVPDHQLSLAIGRDGQNARLAARLTGWKIDIKSESQQAELAVLEAQRAFDEAEAALRAREEARARAEAEAALQAAVEAPEEAPAAAEVEEEPVVAAGAEPITLPADVVEEEAVDGVADRVVDVPAEAWAVDGEAGVAVEEDRAAAVADDEPIGLDVIDLDAWAEAEDDLIDELLLDEEPEDDVVESAAPPPVRARRSRAAKKAELMAVLDDELLDDDEPLPSLFGDTDEGEMEPLERPAGGKKGKRRGRRRKKGGGDEIDLPDDDL